jgi:hypothetical protein
MGAKEIRAMPAAVNLREDLLEVSWRATALAEAFCIMNLM